MNEAKFQVGDQRTVAESRFRIVGSGAKVAHSGTYQGYFVITDCGLTLECERTSIAMSQWPTCGNCEKANHAKG